ncbi:MAG: arylsulfatase [Anaerolineales bacterium]|nr:arylsulfatase [Anaerolineales bacterium]
MSDKKQPNILVIWGDDIGITNLSCYSHGVMGYRTPNIDRLATEGMMFTDTYAEQSCTAGRSSFITGQSVLRTGLSKVGMPGADLGLSPEDPTIATLLKEQGYATAQFDKNHFGDLNKHIPTVHGFDEFFGVFYHLDAYEEPEDPDYPPADRFPDFYDRFGPRNVMHAWATDEDDETVEHRWGKIGKQRFEDTGPLTVERIKSFDDECLEVSLDFIDRQAKADKPFFVWHNTTRMHAYTKIKDEIRGQSGLWQSPYHDGMIEHDQQVGALLDKLDELGIAEDTIVVYSTDNGPHRNTFPDAGTTPFRSEKNTNWEGAFRVPLLLRWPGLVEPGSICNEIVGSHDWLPTFLHAAGEPDVVDQLKQGYKANGKAYKVHIDGYNLMPYLSGETEEHSRPGFMYFSDDGDLMAMRYNNWKFVFLEQRSEGTLEVWANPFTQLRVPKIFNLRTDPYEIADRTSNTFWDFMLKHAFLLVPAQGFVAQFLATFQEFPPRMKAPSFSVDQVIEKLQTQTGLH